MNLKKFSLAAIIGCLVVVGGAEAKDFKYDIHVGTASMDIDGTDNNKALYNVGFGVTKGFSNGVIAGVSFDGEYARVDGIDLYGFGGDLKLGYNVWDKMNVYALGGYKMHSLDGDAAYGFGYGAGVDYPIYKNILGSVEYKTYKMESSNVADYDYTTVGLNLKYAF